MKIHTLGLAIRGGEFGSEPSLVVESSEKGLNLLDDGEPVRSCPVTFDGELAFALVLKRFGGRIDADTLRRNEVIAQSQIRTDGDLDYLMLVGGSSDFRVMIPLGDKLCIVEPTEGMNALHFVEGDFAPELIVRVNLDKETVLRDHTRGGLWTPAAGAPRLIDREHSFELPLTGIRKSPGYHKRVIVELIGENAASASLSFASKSSVSRVGNYAIVQSTEKAIKSFEIHAGAKGFTVSGCFGSSVKMRPLT